MDSLFEDRVLIYKRENGDWFCNYHAKKPSGFLFSEQFERSGSSPEKKKISFKIELRSGNCWVKNHIQTQVFSRMKKWNYQLN